MIEEKVKQLRKILETEKTNLTINDILDGLERLKSFASAGFPMREGEVFRVHVRGTFAYLDLMQTYADSYQVGLVYKGQSFILSEAIMDRSSFSSICELKETIVLKAKELIKSLEEQKDTEADEAEINAICKAISKFCIDSKIPEWIKWVAIDPYGKLWFFDKKPEINKFFNDTWTSRESGYCPMHFYTLDSMEGIDWRKSCVSIDEILQKSSYTKLAETTETIETLTERLNKQEEVIIGLLRFMHDKKFQFDKCSDTRSCGASFEECDEYLKKLGSTPYEYQKRKVK